MRKKLRRYEITEGIEEHPAVLAWKAYSNGDAPTALIALKERVRDDQKSAVYLLKGSGPGGRDLVAKHRSYRLANPIHLARPEALSLLERAQEPVAPRLLGVVPGQHEAWIFLEYVDGVPFDPDNMEHRRGSARLAARIHALDPTEAELATLPMRDALFYKHRLLFTLDQLRSCEADRKDECHPVVARLRARLERVLDSWEPVEQSLREQPRGIVHGDFAAKNLLVLKPGERAEVIAVDWDTVGFGYRFADLECVDLDEYLSVSDTGANGQSREALTAALRLASMLRLINRVAWTVVGLTGNFFARPIRHLEAFDQAFSDLALLK